MILRGRFAPTPSGALHVGSARTALAAALSIWSQGGRYVLRVEDLDTTRTAAGAVDALYEDLAWLGLDWDEGPRAAQPHAPYQQRDRTALYLAALDALRATGDAYPCACSRREVELAAQAPHDGEPVYPGTCRDRDPAAVVADARARGRDVAWRFRVPDDRAVAFDDVVHGRVAQRVAREVGDFVVFRADGVAAYQLAVVVDDIAMEVTEVVRGDDLLGSTARQLLLYDRLGAPPPVYAHVPLVLGDDGSRLAKRLGSMGLRALRAQGRDPTALVDQLLDSLGMPPRRGRSLRAMAHEFSWSRVPRTPWRWPG